MASKKEAAPRAARGKSWLIMILVAVLLAALVGGGAAWFISRSVTAHGGTGADGAAQPGPPPRGPAIYLAIEPAFVVNLADENEIRYLQAEIQIVTRDPKLSDDLRTHMPMVRNRLLLLFSQQRASELRTREQKEALQAAALDEVRAVMESETGRAPIEALLFTSFVTQ